MDNRQIRLEIFEGTRRLYQSSDELANSVKKSRLHQKIYWEGERIEYGQSRFNEPFKFVLSKQKTVEAARKYSISGKRTCILNFASSVSPGGGVVTGAQAQEESICRVSTLYFALSDSDTAGRFYDKHWELIRANKMNRRNTDDVIYTPGIMVLRDDSANEVMLPREEWYEIDVITCAAPDVRRIGDETEYTPCENELMKEFVKRWKCILAAASKHEVDVLILGAFGCGVFANPPELVAQAFKEASADFNNYFETVEFAIYSPGEDNLNYQAFEKCLCAKSI